MALTATVALNATASHTRVINLGTGTLPLLYSPSLTLTDGTGNGQADLLVSDTRVLGSGASEALDLAGGLVDIYGAAVQFRRIKVIIIRAGVGNPSVINVGANSTNGWGTMFTANTDRIRIRPGGLFVMACTEAGAYAVTPVTGDQLFVQNDGSLGSVSYDLILIGASV